MNRPSRARLPRPPREVPNLVAVADDEQLLAWLAECNPRLAALDHEIARRRHLADLAKKEYFPDLTAGAGVIDTGDSPARPRPHDSGQDPVYVMLSLNLPIWYEKLSAGVRQARWQTRAAALQRDELANSLAADLEMALYRYHDAGFKIDLYRNALLPKAVQAQQAADAAFRAGRADFNDLIDTQRVLLEFQLALARASADRGQRLAQIEKLVGRDVAAPAGNRSPRPSVLDDDGQARPTSQPDS
jgi:outer membrane protein TolC